MVETFLDAVWEYYARNKRELPWREEPFDGYKILVSEMMLQQTQVPRVIPKYESFLRRFPNIENLADAAFGDVIREWSGLGYNRRAKYLHEAAKVLRSKSQPWNIEDLLGCKGIGKNTSAAIMVYTYNQPLVFIETNIRTVYIHHFFTEQDEVADTDIAGMLAQTLDREHPREFYYALMDYGSFLKKEVGNVSRSSAHYVKQSVFHGSKRQVRGVVLRQLMDGPRSLEDLRAVISDNRLTGVLDSLVNERLISEKNGTYRL